MGAENRSSNEAALGNIANVGPEVARLIREEVSAAVRQHILGATTQLEPAPPAYDASTRLLASDAAATLSIDPDGSDDDDDSESQSKAAAAKKARLLRFFPSWLRVVILWTPIIAIMVSMAALTISGTDPLGLSVTSFLMLAGMVTIPILFMVRLITSAYEGHLLKKAIPNHRGSYHVSLWTRKQRNRPTGTSGSHSSMEYGLHIPSCSYTASSYSFCGGGLCNRPTRLTPPGNLP
jgi:hypothetical protein